jgi:tRNA (guanine-N7-)-methyltransferase
MSRTKLRKFAEIKEMPNVYESGTNIKWESPLTLELACGKAKFSLQMAQKFPEMNFVGVDRKGERIWKGATTALDLKLSNLKFLQGNIIYIDKDFPTESVDQIWITFPDPHPKDNTANQRLTHPRFLEFYKKILKPTGQICLKTDSRLLLNYTRETILAQNGTILEFTENIYSQKETLPAYYFFQTDFELRHLAENKQIHILRATL